MDGTWDMWNDILTGSVKWYAKRATSLLSRVPTHTHTQRGPDHNTSATVVSLPERDNLPGPLSTVFISV